MKLTIFTPVYNRADIINNLFNSLIRQSNHDFIWLIVDDGSTDKISELVDEYKKSADFEIQYIYQENEGKHSAHNKAVEICNTELFFCVDSDDFLTDDAVEKIYSVHNKYKNEKVLGYFFRKKDTKGIVSGNSFSAKSEYIGLREIYFKYGFSGELAIIFRTELIKNYCFPVYGKEKFVSEKVLYNQISSIAPMVFVDEVIYIFEYQPTGYTFNAGSLSVKNPKGYAMGCLSDAVYGTKWIDRSKAYSSFVAVKKIFNICDDCFPEFTVPFFVKFLGNLFKIHYTNLFRKIKFQYHSEET